MEFKELENGQVLQVEKVETSIQIAIVETFYDMKHHTRLHYENERVFCEVWDYLSNLAVDYNGPIIFNYEGEQIVTQAKNGIAEIEFIADIGTEHSIRTVNEKFRNGEVTFSV